MTQTGEDGPRAQRLRRSLQWVGAVLMVVAAYRLVSHGYWAIVKGRAFHFYLAYLLLPVGFLLFRGSLRTARVVASLTGFLCGLLITALALWLSLVPSGLMRAVVRRRE